MTTILLACTLLLAAAEERPQGYLVWVSGNTGDASSRKIYRMDLPAKDNIIALTSGEDVQARISPNGQWVAYAKARLPGGTDFHRFNMWQVYIISILGIEQGQQEILVDASGYWPSWADNNDLFYSQVDGEHTKIMRASLDELGQVTQRVVFFSTAANLSSIPQVDECFVSPDGEWFAARVRGTSEPGVNGIPTNGQAMVRIGWTGTQGCQPFVAPSGTWAYHAGEYHGIRWGDAPGIENRRENQTLVAAKQGGLCYFPAVSNDEKWFISGHSEDLDQNAGAWDLYLYTLENKETANEQLLVSGGHNSWPSLWVQPSEEKPQEKPQEKDAPTQGCSHQHGVAKENLLLLLGFTLILARHHRRRF